MRHRSRSLSALLFVALLLTSLIVPSGIASAASVYDDVFTAATSARVSDTYDDHVCTARDLTFLWDDYLLDDSMWSHAVYGSGTDRETVQSAFSTALGNGGGWAVTERQFLGAGSSIGNFVWGQGDYGVQVMFTPDADNEVTFFTYGGLDYAPIKGTGSNPVYVVILGQYWNSSMSSCSITRGCL